ncbi:hypothetical protein F5Y13DRAFT_194198 [Hypoxylon sp. FL1857]|nr:hypothetical protein F5Y13DRAFT_194198 [Hypoxylon sp. FL1857]
MYSALATGILPDENRGPTINIIRWVGAGLSTLFVALRIYTRVYITKAQGWDDLIIVLAAIFNIITAALCSVSIAHGMGRHVYYLSDDDTVNALYYGAIHIAPGILAYSLPKLSVVIFLVRLMGNVRRGVWFLYSVIVILFITSILAIVTFLVHCIPVDHHWHPFSPADCIPDHILDTIAYVCGSWPAFTDLVLAIFPITMLWNLQMKRSRKISIMIIMALGFFASVAAIAKTAQLSSSHAEDATWESFWLFILTYDHSRMCAYMAETGN